MISQPAESMNSWTLASISRSRMPGLSHSYLIFHIAASPMLLACLRSSISSTVLTTRAEDGEVDVVYADAFATHTGVVQHGDDAVDHAPGHVRDRALRPLPGNGRLDTAAHPG